MLITMFYWIGSLTYRLFELNLPFILEVLLDIQQFYQPLQLQKKPLNEIYRIVNRVHEHLC